MARELPRTLMSLSRAFQRGVEDLSYEIIVIDNGSDRLPDLPAMQPAPLLRRASICVPSPVGALNEALSLARAPLVGAFIDGARMASPGLLRAAHDAAQCHAHPVIALPNRQLGPNWQAISAQDGYDRATEDALLAQAGWPDPAADLFAVSFPETRQITDPMLESNALFLKADDWQRLGGFDPGFDEAGGGAANPDVFLRANALAGAQLIRVSGEATFHQIHGGTTTAGRDAAVAALKAASRSYMRLRGKPLRKVAQRGWIYDARTGTLDRGMSV
ncbi:glycosyltransferase family 2 protein [Pseudoruegeria sp. SHC-113]|uniref:glycosyltransferase family 2 protein n=1 Tax=Pseudoruegeria sp. SHC-113 TaxID=2855439 RepID=UPI0021BB4E31|nr:glycosyltransferase family A protein [Pseudoruegeria sp. SHC-113]MCT8160151.1 glycosyltransferase family 2 protein [Pseudoruegeria sp. SHC-113]